MPRDASSVYTLPGGNPVIPGTTITSSWANTTLQDIATALTQSLSTDGSTATVNLANKTLNNVTLGTLTSPLSIPNGGTGGATAVAARANLNASRIIAGTANQIVVTNADGVAGAPTLSIASPATFPGALTTTGNITAMPGGFISGSTNTTIANDGTAGNILLRPNGVASTVGQFSVGSNGAVVSAGQIAFNTNLVSSGTNTVIGNGSTGATGVILLRPKGIAETAGEVMISNAGGIIASGGGTFNNNVSFLNNIFSTGVQAALSCGSGTGSGGLIYLRPNGATDTVGQTSIAANGNMTVSGTLTSNAVLANGNVSSTGANFISTTANVALCTTGAGTVYLRPNGAGNSSGELQVNSAGAVTTSSFMTVGGGINFATNLAGTGTNVVIGNGQSGGTGSILLRPKGVADSTAQMSVDNSGNVVVAGQINVGGSVIGTGGFYATTANAILATSAAGTVYLRPNGAGSSTGEVTVNSGGVLAPTSGQIQFPAVANPSAGANVLDDYEEGNFTPILNFGGASTGWTFSAITGTYVKTGRKLWIQITIQVTAKGSATGACTIDGLPFSNSVASQAPAYVSGIGGFTGLTPPVHGNVTASSMAMFMSTSGGQATLTDVPFTSSSVFRVSTIYGAT